MRGRWSRAVWTGKPASSSSGARRGPRRRRATGPTRRTVWPGPSAGRPRLPPAGDHRRGGRWSPEPWRVLLRPRRCAGSGAAAGGPHGEHPPCRAIVRDPTCTACRGDGLGARLRRRRADGMPPRRAVREGPIFAHGAAARGEGCFSTAPHLAVAGQGSGHRRRRPANPRSELDESATAAARLGPAPAALTGGAPTSDARIELVGWRAPLPLQRVEQLRHTEAPTPRPAGDHPPPGPAGRRAEIAERR